MKQKNILICWSGGLDSTTLIYKNLLDGHKVTARYVSINNNTTKIVSEKQAINKILPIFIKYPNFYFENEAMEIKVNSIGNNLTFYQAPIWLLAGAYNCDGFDEFQIGYVMNDDFVSYISEATSCWDKLMKLCIRERPIKIKFPLIKHRKEDLIDFLRLADAEILKYVTWCEYPTVENGIHKYDCQNCVPCRRYASLLHLFNNGRKPVAPMVRYAKSVKIIETPKEVQSELFANEKEKLNTEADGFFDAPKELIASN